MLQIWWLCLGLSKELMICSNKLIEENLIKGPFTKASRGFRETLGAWSLPSSWVSLVPQPFPPSTLQCHDSTHRKPEGNGACGYTL